MLKRDYHVYRRGPENCIFTDELQKSSFPRNKEEGLQEESEESDDSVGFALFD